MRWFIPSQKLTGTCKAGPNNKRRLEPARHTRASLICARGHRGDDMSDWKLADILRKLPAITSLARNCPKWPVEVSPWMSTRNLDTTLSGISQPPMGGVETWRCARGVGWFWPCWCEDKTHPEIVEISHNFSRISYCWESIWAVSAKFDKKTRSKGSVILALHL